MQAEVYITHITHSHKTCNSCIETLLSVHRPSCRRTQLQVNAEERLECPVDWLIREKWSDWLRGNKRCCQLCSTTCFLAEKYVQARHMKWIKKIEKQGSRFKIGLYNEDKWRFHIGEARFESPPWSRNLEPSGSLELLWCDFDSETTCLHPISSRPRTKKAAKLPQSQWQISPNNGQ